MCATLGDPGRRSGRQRKRLTMAAMKPRTGDGPLEVVKEGRSVILRMPLEGGGRLVVEMTPVEASALSETLNQAMN